MESFINCPQEKSWRHFSLGEVRETEAAQLEEHLARCPHCVETLHTLQAEDTLVDAMRAQKTLQARPKIDVTIFLLMEKISTWKLPSLSEGASQPESGDQSAIEEMMVCLAPAQEPGEIGRLGPYRLLKVLGAGGMGVVFAAEDTQLRRPVALKALRPLLAASSTCRKRFLREARAAAAVVHDHVISIFHVGEEHGIPYLVMPYLEGETLGARLQREGPLPVADIVRIGCELAQGLAAAHGQGLLHRDIKPANIWLESVARSSLSVAKNSRTALAMDQGPRTTDYRVKLLDFGLAWSADSEEPLTAPGTVIGTPPYMSPEQARGEPADFRSDLFSLGSVLYALCTGSPPFQGSSKFATLEKVRTELPRPIQELNSGVPAWLVALVNKLQAKNPADRYQTAREVADTLAQHLETEPAGSAESITDNRLLKAQSRASRRWWIGAAGLFFPLVSLILAETTGLTHFRAIIARPQEETGLIQTGVFNQKGENQEKPVGNIPPKPSVPVSSPTTQTGNSSTVPGAKPEPEPVPMGPAVYPAAILPFEERGVRDLGPKVTDILFAKLVVRPELFLVDRAELNKTLAELELNLSGAVKPGEANKIGQLSGAKLLISGSVITIDQKIYLVAKIIGTETSRVLGASVDGKASEELAPLVEQLAEKVAHTIVQQADKLVARPTTKADRLAALKLHLKGTRPTLMIQINERHIGAPRIDPAAQTEMSRFSQETGFTLLDPEEGLKSKTDILITGEAFSELAARHGNLVSVKARVEVKAVDRKTDQIVAVDRQTAVVIDLTENIAAKGALEEAAAILAERMLPRLVKP